MRRAAIVAATALFSTTGLVAGTALLAAATPAAAAGTGSGIGSNYSFPDGSPGFNLSLDVQNTDLAIDGILNPEVLVGFNPQPDPPGAPQTFLSLTNPVAPVFTNLSPGLGYTFVMSFLNLLPAGCDPTTIARPNSDGRTGLSCSGEVGDQNVSIDVALMFSGPGGVTSWSSFNPQPDPPGDVGGFDLSFGGDANVTVSISANGTPLAFGVPEPGTLTLFGTALIGLASWRRKHRRA
jgi:hypothetical protein